ncbi:SusD/RagB family nutrient-binding outer membrane lipoprotein [Bacteroidota bacterium]
MKKILILLSVPILIAGFTSCAKFVEGWDESPNSPTEATPALFLSNTEVSTFASYTGQTARTAAILVQQCTGTNDQMFNVIQNYNITETDITNEWQHLYESCMHSSKVIMRDYSEGYPYYLGIAKVLMAMNLGLTTDCWGDVPYSEAFEGLQGEDYFHPHFDTQQTVLETIQTLLDEGISELSKPASENTVLPGADDIIFGGDPDSWIITAWMLKARYAMRYTKRNETKATSDAMSFVASAYSAGLAGSDEDCMANFDGSGNDQSQWWAFERNRGGYLRMNEFFVDLLKDKSDPRLPFYVGTTSSAQADSIYLGAPMGSTDNAIYSFLGSAYNAAGATLPLITYAEVKFIEAEAQFRQSNLTEAADAYNEAVTASVEKIIGAAIPASYKNTEANETNATISLEKIMVQKYIALFTQPEVWSDWRRTDFPTIQPYADATGINQIPRRFPLEQSERINNINAPDPTPINIPVWWDSTN